LRISDCGLGIRNWGFGIGDLRLKNKIRNPKSEISTAFEFNKAVRYIETFERIA